MKMTAELEAQLIEAFKEFLSERDGSQHLLEFKINSERFEVLII